MHENVGLVNQNDSDIQVPVEHTYITQQATSYGGTSSRLIPDIQPEQYDPGMTTNELYIVYQVLKENLSKPQRQQTWEKWKSVLGRYPLSSRNPFLNIVKFVNDIALENGLDNLQKFKLRSELLRSLIVNSAYGNKNPGATNITLKNRAQKIRFKFSGLTKFESAMIGIDEKSNLILMTKRRMVTGTPVRIQVPKGQGDENSSLRISGYVAHIDTSKSGSHFKYIIQVKNTDQAIAA